MEVSSHPVIIPDSFVSYPPKSFCIPSFYSEDVESVLIPEGLIRDRIKGLAREIFSQYSSSAQDPEPLVLVCVLKSSFKFFCALQLEIERLNVEACYAANNQHPSIQDAAVVNGEQHLHNGTKNGTHAENMPVNNKRALPLLCEFIRVKSYVNTTSAPGNENVLIVEDIIDSGRTMHALIKNLKQYNAKSLRVVSMLWKRVFHGEATNPSFVPDFFGFEIPDRFVIGFGMDYNEKFRDLNHLCIISQSGIQKYAMKAP